MPIQRSNITNWDHSITTNNNFQTVQLFESIKDEKISKFENFSPCKRVKEVVGLKRIDAHGELAIINSNYGFLKEENDAIINFSHSRQEINENFNLLGNLTEMQRLYINWRLDPGYKRFLEDDEIRSGLHDWALWRTKLNENLILTSLFNTPFTLNQNNTNFILDKEANKNMDSDNLDDNKKLVDQFKIEPQIARFIYYLGFTRDRPFLDPESFMFYGLPRARVNKNFSQNEIENVESDSNSVYESDKTEPNSPINEKLIHSNETVNTPAKSLKLSPKTLKDSNKKPASPTKRDANSIELNQFAQECKENEPEKKEQKNSTPTSKPNKQPHILTPFKQDLKTNNNTNKNSLRGRTNSEPRIITGINVKEKVKAFEHAVDNNNDKLNKSKLNSSFVKNNKLQKSTQNENNIEDRIAEFKDKRANFRSSDSKLNVNKSVDDIEENNQFDKTNNFNNTGTNRNSTSFFNSDASIFLDEVQLMNMKNQQNFYQVQHKQSRGGLAAAILTSSLSNSSQFISPPLPGHLTAEHKRDRSNDADLKRGINVNSLILNTTHIDETATMVGSEFHRQEPDNELVMMMMPNDLNFNQNSRHQPIDSKLSYLNKTNNNSSNNKNMTSSITSSNNGVYDGASFGKPADVLKAAEGDIIFGNHQYQHSENNNEFNKMSSMTKDSNTSRTTPGTPNHARLKNNIGLPEINLTPNRQSRNVESNKGASPFMNSKKMSGSVDSINAKQQREATRFNEKKTKSRENLNSPTDLQTNRNVIVDGLKRNVQHTLFDGSKSKDRESPKNLNDNSASSKTKAKETKQKLIKNERYNYLSPLKNMLKSKNKSHDEGLKAAAVAAVEAAVLALSPNRKRSESGDKNKQEKENEHHHHHHHRRHRRHHHRHHHSENDQENTTKTRTKSKSRNKDSTLDSSTQHRHHHRHRHHHHHHHKTDKSQNISSNDTANISSSFRNQDGLKIKTGEVKKEPSKLLKLKSSPFNTILSHKKTKTVKSNRSQRGKSKSRHGSIKSVSRTKKKAHKNYISVNLAEKNDVLNQSKTKTKKTLKHKTTRSRLIDFGHMPPESLQSKVSKYLNESKDLQLLSTFSFHNMDNINSNDKDIIDLSSFSSVTLESNKTSRSASSASAESKDRKIGLIPSSKKTHRYQLSGTKTKKKTPSIHDTIKKSEKKLNSSKKPKENKLIDTKSRKHNDESANVTINDGTLNMTSLNSNFNPANSSLNTTKNTNKLDVDTKKKIISNALEQAKTLKPPNIPAPLLMTHPDTPPPILVPPPPLQTLLSNSKNKDKVKTKKSVDLNKSHDANQEEMNKFNEDFSSRLGKNSTNLNKIAPPNQPPPPPPIDHTRGKIHNTFERESVENRDEEDKVDRKHISYKTQVKIIFFLITN